jgi:GxxExxY protein
LFRESELTETIIGAAIEVHRVLGPGLLESAYQACLAQEFLLRQVPFEREKPLFIEYKTLQVDCAYRLDFVVQGKVIIELKAVDMMLLIHEAQILTYLKLTGCHIGLLINFNVPVLKKGIRRLAL